MLNFDRNFITEIPGELTECRNIFQMSFVECARLFVLPKNLLAMPNLTNISLSGCCLFTLPSIASSSLANVLLHGNQLLNCVPHEIAQYLPSYMTTAQFYSIEEENLEELLAEQ